MYHPPPPDPKPPANKPANSYAATVKVKGNRVLSHRNYMREYMRARRKNQRDAIARSRASA